MSKEEAEGENEPKELKRKYSAVSLNDSPKNINDMKINFNLKDVRSSTKNNFYKANTSQKGLNDDNIKFTNDAKFIEFMKEQNKINF